MNPGPPPGRAPGHSGHSRSPAPADPAIRRKYAENTPRSARAFEETARFVPGGNSRQAGFWAPYPLTIARGEGALAWDLDGNRYIDLLNNYTALVHGHAYPPIVSRVAAQVPLGTCWAANSSAQTELASELVNRVASIDQLRFTNSGTEAGALALSIARSLTGRDKILMARYGYHGGLSEFMAGFSGTGGPRTHVAEFGNATDFEKVLTENGREIAAVFLEPVLGAGGVVTGSREFIGRVARAAREAGALFVLDEVLTLRLATGGRQMSLGIEPDLTMFGKLIGGGFPVGAVGASGEIMKVFDPSDLRLFHSGTFNANPVTMAAGAVCVAELTAQRIDEMERLAGRLKSGLLDAASAAGLPLSLNHCGSILNLFFAESPAAAVQVRPDAELMDLFHLAAMNHGLILASRGLIALSTVMDDALIDEVVERAAAAMQDVAGEQS